MQLARVWLFAAAKQEPKKQATCHVERSETSHLFASVDVSCFALNMTRKRQYMPTRKGTEYAEILRVDFKCFQAKGEGSYLNDNDRALSEESFKSSRKITQEY